MGRWRLLHFSRFYLNFKMLQSSDAENMSRCRLCYIFELILCSLRSQLWFLNWFWGFLKHRFISKKDLNILSWSWTGSGPGVATLPAQLSVTSNTKCATATAQSKSFSRRRKTRLHHHDHYKDFSSRKMTSLNNK